MVVPGSPSLSQLDDKRDPKPTEAPQKLPPQSETLDYPNPPHSPLHDQIVLSDNHEDIPTIFDGYDQLSSKTHTTLPEPVVLANDIKNPLRSPRNHRGRSIKRKKGSARKITQNKRVMKKIENLTDALNPIPFIPKVLDLDKHEDVLKRLGLYDFTKIEFDRSIRTDLLIQLIVNFDSKKRCSYVDEKRISVSRADLARALQLPITKQDKGSRRVEEVDLDSEVFSDEVIGFIEDFVFNWMLIHEESWDMPAEIVNWTRCIRDGHPEKLDSASLIWYKVEKELTQGDKLADCYYASHLQCLIRSQKDQLFKEVDDVGGGVDEGEEVVKADEELGEKEEQEVKVSIVQEHDIDKSDEILKADKEQDEKEERDEKEQDEKVYVVQERDVELTLGPDVEKTVHQEGRKDDETMVDTEECEYRKNDETMVDTAECKEKEVEEQVNWKNGLNEPILQRCQLNDLNDLEEIKVEEVEDEQIVQVEDEDVEVEEEEGASERFIEGFEIDTNDDSMDNFHGVSNVDLFKMRDDSFMSHGGPPFFDNGGKRVMEPEEGMHHFVGNSKRLKTDKMWDHNQNEFGDCMEQIQQWMEKAKMIHVSKEESSVNLQCHQNLAIGQLQERNQMMEMVIKSRDEELKKKNAEMFRLERELYLMVDLLAGYRKALNDTRFKFLEYRRRVAHQEEPLYKDAGPGGLVLSTRELEKRRLKQEEYMMKFQTLVKSYEEECVYHLNIQGERVLKMAEKLLFVGNEVNRLKEIATQRKETHKLRDVLELSPQQDENQKSHENDASKENVPPDADESKEKGGDEEH